MEMEMVPTFQSTRSRQHGHNLESHLILAAFSKPNGRSAARTSIWSSWLVNTSCIHATDPVLLLRPDSHHAELPALEETGERVNGALAVKMDHRSIERRDSIRKFSGRLRLLDP
jgi:hypothetical protein